MVLKVSGERVLYFRSNIMKLFYYAFLCFSFVIFHKNFCKEEYSFKATLDPLYTGVIFETYTIGVYERKSKIRCSSFCYNTVGCRSFGYDGNKLECRLYNTSSFDRWNAFHTSSSCKTYKLNTNGCPIFKGYKYERNLSLCFMYNYDNIEDAAVVCSKDGGHLLRITSPDIQSHIEDFLEDLSLSQTIYIDGSREDVNSNFTFSNGVQMEYFNFNSDIDLNVTRHKLKISGSNRYRWFLSRGSTNRPFFCQIDL